jgi:hypothetical protein
MGWRVLVQNLAPAHPAGGVVNIQGADNGNAAVILDNVAVCGAGGVVNMRAGQAGPAGSGGALTIKNSSIAGGR